MAKIVWETLGTGLLRSAMTLHSWPSSSHNFSLHQIRLEDLLKQIASPTCHSVGLGWGLIICVSKFCCCYSQDYSLRTTKVVCMTFLLLLEFTRKHVRRKIPFNDNNTSLLYLQISHNPPLLQNPNLAFFLLTVRFSEMYFLALAIGSACALMVIIVIVVVLFQHFRKKRWAERAHKVVEIKS